MKNGDRASAAEKPAPVRYSPLRPDLFQQSFLPLLQSSEERCFIGRTAAEAVSPFALSAAVLRRASSRITTQTAQSESKQKSSRHPEQCSNISRVFHPRNTAARDFPPGMTGRAF